MRISFKTLTVIFIAIFILQNSSVSKTPAKNYQKVRVIASTYYAHKWSDIGRYRRVSKNGKRLGNFVALNFLPGGSIIMIPKLFKTTKFEVADTFGGSGTRYYKGKKYWKVDILRNKGEWYDDIDHPIELIIAGVNHKGPVKNLTVRKNFLAFLKGHNSPR